MTLLSAGLAYVLAVRAVTFEAKTIGSTVPKEIEPLIIVLLLGIVTDYSVFFLTGLRERLQQGKGRVSAARETTQQYLPIILTAGLLVAGGVATLRVAKLGFFQALGPAMAITVVVGVALSVTWVPALMGILGRFLFWPGIRGSPVQRQAGGTGATRAPDGLVGFARRRGVSALVAVAATAVLALAGSGLVGAHLGLNPIQGPASEAAPQRGAILASKGFAPGIVAPSELVLRGPGIAGKRKALTRFGRLLEREPGIAGVVGPGRIPFAESRGLLRARGGDAARYLVVLGTHPFGAAAIHDLRRVESDVPASSGAPASARRAPPTPGRPRSRRTRSPTSTTT